MHYCTYCVIGLRYALRDAWEKLFLVLEGTVLLLLLWLDSEKREESSGTNTKYAEVINAQCAANSQRD